MYEMLMLQVVMIACRMMIYTEAIRTKIMYVVYVATV